MTGDGPRAVVADDSQFMRTVITDILESGGVEVVATARDGREAVDAVAECAPDVVTMDVEMPRMDGIEAVARIVEECPTPVLMLSAHTDERADVTFEALEAGAVDFFTKPGGEISMAMSRLEEQLVEMVRSVAAADVPSAAGNTPHSTGSSATAPLRAGYAEEATVIVGASTGGPREVERVLTALPGEADLRLLVVQHMPAGFTGRFAARLDTCSEYDVREATDGDRIGGGEALVAPGGSHMRVTSYASGRLRVTLTDEPPVHNVRPAVDVTMTSAAEVADGPLVGVVLTGMGEDGAAGIAALKAAGARTIAQDEQTSAVFGMPKRAIETGAVDEVLPIDELRDGIVRAVRTETA